MMPAAPHDSWRDHEAIYDRFEQAWSQGPPSIADFLPPDDHPAHRRILHELVKIDLERRWTMGQPIPVQEYLQRYPALAADGVVPLSLLVHEAECREAEQQRPTAPPPELLGRYQMQECIGHGGFASVYKAWDPELHREVAIKIPRADVVALPEVRSRLQREARSAAKLRHPAIVPLHEVGSDEQRVWLVYEYVAGPTLAHVLRTAPPAPQQAAQWVATLAAALDYAHHAGVIHRDVKPANVLLRGGHEPMLTDFGLALHAEQETITHAGDILGTPAYMSPEQASGRGHAVDGRTDVYSLGAMLYELLTGQLPFREATHVVLHKVLHDDPTPPRTIRREIPLDLETICLKAMAKEPARRYATAGLFAADLQRYLKHEPIHARRIGIAGQFARWYRRNTALALTLAVALLLIVAVTIFSYRQVIDERDRLRYERDRNQQLASHLALDRGLNLCEQGDIGAGLLWLVRSLELTPVANQRQQEVIRLNLAAWSERMPVCLQMIPHEHAVSAVLFSRDGRSIYVGEHQGAVRRWRWDRLIPESSGLASSARILTMTTDPHRNYVVLGDTGGELQLSRPLGDHTPHRIRLRGDIYATAHHPTAPTVLAALGNDQAALVSLVNGAIIHTFTLRQRVQAVGFHPKGEWAITGSDDAIVWNLQTNEAMHVLKHPRQVLSIAVSPDGHTLATGCEDRRVRIWDARTFQLLRQFEHQAPVVALTYNATGEDLLAASRDRQVRLWDPQTGRLRCPPLHHPDHVTSLSFHPDEPIFATGCEDGVVRIWRSPPPLNDGASLEQRGTVWSATFTPDGEHVFSGSGLRGQPGTAALWHFATRTETRPPMRTPDAVYQVAVHPQQQSLLVGRFDGVVTLHDFTTGQSRLLPVQRKAYVTSAGFAPDGATFLIGWASQHFLEVFDTTTGQPTGQRLMHDGPVRALAFDRHGKTLLTGSHDRTARRWRWPAGDPLEEPLWHFGQVGAVALRGDGQEWFVGTDAHFAQRWDHADKAIASLQLHHRGTVRSLAYHPTRSLVLTGSWDQTARLWEPDSGKPIGPPLPHTAEVETVAFHPHGRRFLTGGWDERIHFWRVPDPIIGTLDELRLHMETLAGQVLQADETLRRFATDEWQRRFRTLHP